ncbi:MAG TPA: AAA family ATPase [Rhizomicrobium sp.]|jgi:receptor protein-tyrosine kinase|nr:AAA family ATPase [Rhizomicrobium sp.]
MSESLERLNLIQRAAKRLAEQPVQAAEPRPAIEQPAMRREVASPQSVAPEARLERAEPPQPRMNGSAQPAAITSRPVRLNLTRIRQAQIVTPDNTSSTTYNEFRAIKRRLIPMARAQNGGTMTNNLFMVTSALPGEGKTFTAMNLAISLAAERNLHVILIDGDVVRSSLDAYFDGANGLGLTELLNGKCRDVNEVMHRCVDVPNLRVIFAGKHDAGSPELLASKRMGDICQDLATRYPDRIILIDAPPVLAAAEPAALVPHMNHVIMVVAAQQPSRHHVEEALTKISSARNIMMLFNKSPQWRHTSAASYYYYYRKDTEAAAG